MDWSKLLGGGGADMLGGMGMEGFGGGGQELPLMDTAETIHISSLALIKVFYITLVINFIRC